MINEIKFVVVVYFEIKETTIPFGDVFYFLHWINVIRLSMHSIWQLGQLPDLVDKGLSLLYRFLFQLSFGHSLL